MNNNYEVIIVGAGPAGLATAFELSSISDLDILLIDKGKSIKDRICSSLEKLCLDHPICDITHGSGGAGLYSDGKLCLDPNVGGDISRFYNKSETRELMKRVVDMLNLNNSPIKSLQPNKEDLSAYMEAFNSVGLNFKYYDVVRVPLKERIKKVESIEEYLRKKNVNLLFNTEAERIYLDDNYKITTSRGEFHSKYMIIAPGKVGANWFYNQYKKLNISSKNNPLYLGVRLELPREITSGLSNLTDNPKISMNFSNDDYIKTHCFSDKGRVAIADYYELKLVEGIYLEERETENASVNIVMKLNLPEYVLPYNFSKRFIQQINSFGKGRPVVQKVEDLFDFCETDSSALNCLSITPTLNDCKCGDLSNLYSMRFADRLSKFLKKIDLVLPGFAQGENLIYAPYIEWWMKKIEVNKKFETPKENLYAVGDGAGMSQGIIAAGMQGIACARGIYEKSKRKI